MNCKPGDLAIVVLSPAIPELLGMIVQVTKLSDEFPNSWDTEPPVYISGNPWPVSFDDRSLRPIRDPGDDAQDETLQWLDVPSKIEA